jgi:hypothetical protein
MVDLAIINSPLPDDFGTQLALDLAERNISVLIFVNRDISDQVASKVELPESLSWPSPCRGRNLYNQSRF